MTSPFVVRRATPADIPVIVRQRVQMFSDMGRLPPDRHDSLAAMSIEYLEVALPSGEYIGWLAAPRDAPEQIVGGAGVQRRRGLPHPLGGPDGVRIARGDQGLVLNVYTEPAFRRRGVAERLMRDVIEWAASVPLDTLVLHASDEGRTLYERLGFVATNEMRFTGRLDSREERGDRPR